MVKEKVIAVYGLGYIGLPTAALFADAGYKVIGIDVNKAIVNRVNMGQVHISEPGLDKVVEKSVKQRKLSASCTTVSADVFIVAVPTPFKKNQNGELSPDISHVNAAINSISSVLKKGDLIIIESTVPVGTTEKLRDSLNQLRPDLQKSTCFESDPSIYMAYCPERVLPGQILNELVTNDRIIGGICEESANYAASFYSSVIRGECHKSSATVAEMVKLTENAARDAQIAFANEISIICDQEGIDAFEVIALANKHPRANILQPGPGVGGHCIAVDPWFLIDPKYDTKGFIKAARLANLHKSDWVTNKIIVEINALSNTKDVENKVNVVLFGLSYKPNIDDLRESPALYIAEALTQHKHVNLSIVEPNIDTLPNTLISKAKLITNFAKIEDCDVIVFLVNHDEFIEFRSYDFANISILDFCGIFKSS